ncbi:unnamed protein product [Chrysodeixis includens]|uniref:Uncharacterized protein n=1 Tax=Chrysodeixis includens TaxID=689277 RepID=A0A9N8Q2K3_CHRIL|nr:unnamed protein product [Chrysodeixis includens]
MHVSRLLRLAVRAQQHHEERVVFTGLIHMVGPALVLSDDEILFLLRQLLDAPKYERVRFLVVHALYIVAQAMVPQHGAVLARHVGRLLSALLQEFRVSHEGLLNGINNLLRHTIALTFEHVTSISIVGLPADEAKVFLIHSAEHTGGHVFEAPVEQDLFPVWTY